MAANVFATPGSLYLTPTKAATGGTLISGIEEQLITFMFRAEVVVRRTGTGANEGFRSRMRRVGPALLRVPLRQQDSTALKILFSHLTTDGTTLRPTGGTAAIPFAILPAFALVLRPKLSTEKHIYAPKWRLASESEQHAVFGEVLPNMEGNVLNLIANWSETSGVPAWMWGASADIDTAYSL